MGRTWNLGEMRSHCLRVLHVIVGLEVGGAERMLARLATARDDALDLRHTVVSLTTVGTVGLELQRAGVEVRALGWEKVYQVPLVLMRLIHVIRAIKPDVVQTWMYHSDLLGGIAARFAGCRNVVWGIRNTDVFGSEGVARSTEWIMRACAVLSSVIPRVIVCVAERAKVSHAQAGYCRRKMVVVHNGFAVNDFDVAPAARHRLRSEWRVPTDGIVIGSIARFNSYKDHLNLISAATEVARKVEAVYFVLAGRNVDASNAELTSMISRSGGADRFRLLGEIHDIAAVLSAFDVFCLHSKSEGFPNVLGEAMCASLSCVATDVGDAGLLLGDTGLVVAPGDPTALALGLVCAARETPQERQTRGTEARQRIVENFSLAEVERQYASLYRKTACR